MTLRKKYLVLLLSLTGISLWSFVTLKTTTNQKSMLESTSMQPGLLDSLSTTANTQAINQYNALLEEEESKVWQELESQYAITHDEVMRIMTDDYIGNYMKRCNKESKDYAEYKNLKLQQSTIALVHEVLHDFHLPVDSIAIYAWDIETDAATSGSSIFINEQRLLRLSRAAQKFMIGHEMIHYIYKDLCVIEILEKLVQKKGLPAESAVDPHHPVNVYTRFIEKRADIIASLHSQEYATGNQICVMQQLQVRADYAPITHPSLKERLALAQDIKAMTASA